MSTETTTTTPTTKYVILDYIFTQMQDDNRPHLEVNINGKKLLGLLDSGANSIVLGRSGWNTLRPYCQLNTNIVPSCIIANGEPCPCIGTLTVPIQLKDRVKIFEVLVVPSIPHVIILGTNFWIRMGIIPDLYAGEWSFRTPFVVGSSNSICSIQAYDTLTQEQRFKLEHLIDRSFVKTDSEKIGCTRLVEHKIKLRDNTEPIKQRHYPLSPTMQKFVNEELEEMLHNDIIEPSNSPWSSPVVMVKKKNSDKYRFCVDYRALNKVSEPDAYPIPFVSATLDKLRDARYLTTLDIKSAYWQIPMAKDSRPLTAFVVPSRGLFQFKRMPFGLHSAPATWQRLIDRVIGVDLENYVFVYLDDVIVCTPSFEKHYEVLEKVLSRLSTAGLSLSREKCNFCKPELRYLGYVVNACGLNVDPEKVEAIVNIPTPRNVREVRRVVGLASWYRRFVPQFSTVVAPLTSLLKKNTIFKWTENCEEALQKIKRHLISAPVLSCPDFDLPFTIQTDASDYGLGAVLTQVHPDGSEKVICYLSRSLHKNERKFSTTEKECLAVLFAIEKLRPYIEGTRFTVITDHYSLKWLHSIKDPVGRIARWAVRLQQYDFDIIHRKGKDNIVPDVLSRTVPVLDMITNSTEQEPVGKAVDPWYNRMVKNVTTYPAKYPLWRVQSGQLYKRVRLPYPQLAQDGDDWRKVAPREDRQNIIRSCHDPPTCGHPGIFKTTARVAENFYWPKMKHSVAKFVRQCTTCIQTKPELKKPAGGMLSASCTASRPWELVSIDLVGPLPRSSSGYSYILSVQDTFSKFVLLFPLRTATASAVTHWFEDHVILVFGAPERVILDNGVQFRSNIFKNLMQEYDIKLCYVANYHPQANPVERVHSVLKNMLSAYVGDNHRVWDKYLPKVACAMRSARHETTGLTPNFIMFGREIRLSGKPRQLHDGEAQQPLEFENRSEQLNKVFEDVKKRLVEASNRSRKYYNLRHRPEKFLLHQKVWKRNHLISDASKHFTSKLAPKYTGPFSINKVLGPWSYELVDAGGRSLGVWNAKDLKAHPPDSDADQDF